MPRPPSTGFWLDLAADPRDLRAVERRLAKMADRAIDMRPAMQMVKQVMTEGHIKNFESQGTEFGGKWPLNAPGTVARKLRMGQGTEPMKATGALEKAIHGGKGRRTRVGKTSVRVGVSLPQARYNLIGSYTAATNSRRPRRATIGMSRGTRSRALEICERFIVEGLL